jgi:hypothetical protein
MESMRDHSVVTSDNVGSRLVVRWWTHPDLVNYLNSVSSGSKGVKAFDLCGLLFLGYKLELRHSLTM